MFIRTLLVAFSALLGVASAQINSVTFTGSGCPPGTVGQATSLSGLNQTMIFQAYLTNLGDESKDCAISISFTTPAGWSAAALNADYRGLAQLLEGATARLNTAGAGRTFVGPTVDDFTIRETSRVSGAGGTTRTIVVNTSFTLSGSITEGDKAIVDSIDFSFIQAS